jgi:uncharacterized membrane protein
MNLEMFLQLISRHKGKTTGITLGFLFGIFTVILGFWKTFFIALCITVGFFLGKRFDENDHFKDIMNKFLNNK